jgi:hypothetical protein
VSEKTLNSIVLTDSGRLLGLQARNYFLLFCQKIGCVTSKWVSPGRGQVSFGYVVSVHPIRYMRQSWMLGPYTGNGFLVLPKYWLLLYILLKKSKAIS